VRRDLVGLLAVAVLGLAGSAAAQSARVDVMDTAAMPATAMSTSGLPDAPEPATQPAATPAGQTMRIAPRYHLDIQADETSQTLNVRQKYVLAAYQDVNGNIVGPSFLAAAFSQLLNSDPKYGTDKGAFGQRYGAAILRETSQQILYGGVGDSLFHDDPRYYILGDGHGIVRRVWYAATRVVVTRTDSGGEALNSPLLLGYLGAAALTQTYYPAPSRGASKVFEGYIGSLGGVALGFGYHQFLGDALRIAHLKRD